MEKDLIFDIGLHEGEDSDFYLQKGFRVIGVEANPELADFAAKRFRDECEAGRLTIVNKAISEIAGTIDFYVNDRFSSWGTADRSWMLRNQKRGTTSHVIRVPSIRTGELLIKYGVPYYMKVDIEGFDELCVSDLIDQKDKPRYVSVETHAFSLSKTLDLLMLLQKAGYDLFKIVSQKDVGKQRCPDPALEGKYLDYRFGWGASGLFGEELPGQWLTIDETKSILRRIYFSIRMRGVHTGIFREVKNRHVVRALTRLFPEGTDWFDIHGRLSS